MSEAPFLLLHGLHAAPWVWDRLIPHLSRPALAPHLDLDARGTTLEGIAAELVRTADAFGFEEEVTLVLHGLAGALLSPLLARLEGRVPRIVLIGAVVPTEGRPAAADLHPRTAPITLPLLRRRYHAGHRPSFRTLRRSAGSGLRILDITELSQATPPHFGTLLLAPGLPLPTAVPPIHYLRITGDPLIPLRVQDRVTRRLPGVRSARLAGEHFPMFTRPRALATFLEEGTLGPTFGR